MPPGLLCAIILLVMGANLFSLIQRKSITNDEIVHIPAGYHYLYAGNFHLNPEHPPLAKMWASLPLLVLRPEVDLIDSASTESFARLSELSAIEFWRLNQERARTIGLWSRVPMIVLTIGLGILIFIFGKQLFGARAALFAVALFSIEPTMLAHGKIVHTDIAAAFGYLFFIFAMYRYYRNRTWSNALWFGLVTGVALLTKFSLVVLAPVFIGVLAYMVWKPQKQSRRRMLGQASIALFTLLFIVNAAYLFKRTQPEQASLNSFISAVPQSADRILAAIKIGSIIVPTPYLFGLSTVFIHNHDGHSASLLGQQRQFGWWYYFPIAFALKTTLPFLILSVLALCWAAMMVAFDKDRKVTLLFIAVVFYLAMSMTGNINIGIRHIAPIFPPLFLITGAFADRMLKSKRASRAAALALVFLFGWMIFETVRVYPDYLSFTNQLSFGKPGWQLLSDSNVEWGEDIGSLAAYLHQQGETELVGSISGGWAVPQMYGIKLLDRAPANPESSGTRYVVLGAGFLNGSSLTPVYQDADGNELAGEALHNYFARYRTLEPEMVFGNSIYLYRVHK